MICPKCEATLEAVTFNGIEVDRCSGCQGIWFDHHEEEQLKKLRGAATALDTGDKNVGAQYNQMQNTSCPRCQTTLHHVFHHGAVEIHFERCNECKGSFFDAGEFSAYVTDEVFDEFESVMTTLGHLESGQNLVDG